MNKQTSQLIGIILLSLIIITYFQYFGQKPSTPTSQPVATEVPINKGPITQIKELAQSTPHSVAPNKKVLKIENENMCVWLDPKGGMIKKVSLKKYKGTDQAPLSLLAEEKSYMTWLLPMQDSVINTKDLDFTIDRHSNQISFTYMLDAEGQKQIRYTYTLPKKGYTLNCKVDISGFNPHTDKAQLVWYYAPENMEKDFQLNSRNTYVQYQLQKKGLKYLGQDQKASLQNVKWAAIKQRFFTAGIIAPKNAVFTQGELITRSASAKDKNTLMETAIKLEMHLKGLNENTHTLTFYFGPNIYQTLAQVAPGFENNHYLGWPVIKQINKYTLAPLADLLDTYTNHYVWVLLLLVLFLKLLQLYLIYKDYIITLKQKALQPAVEELKARYTDKQQAKLAEIHFYTKMGLPPSSYFVKIFLLLIETPIFISMFHLIPNHIASRHVPFLWIKDLSGVDNFIHLPFHMPLLGSHISLFAVLMGLSSLMRSKQSKQEAPTDQNARLFKYILPIVMFLAFNSYPAAFCLYRIFTDVISIMLPLLFKLFVNENAHLSQMVQEPQKVPVVSRDIPRTLARLEKKRKNS